MPQLPGYNFGNALIDFSPVANALSAYQKKQQFDQQMGMDQQKLDMEKESHALQKQNMQRQWSQQDAERAGNEAFAIQNMQGPAKGIAWQRYLKTYGDGDHTPEELDPNTGPAIAAAHAGKYIDQMKQRMGQAELEKTKAETAKLYREASGEGGRHGLNPIYGTDENGNIVLLQAKESGGVDQAKLPAGVTISKTPIKLDAGDHFVLLDPITRQPVGSVQKNIAEAASLKEQGESQGKARANMPLVEQNANRMISQIDELMGDKGLDRITGSVYGRLPEFTNTSEEAKSAQSRVDQVLGGAFLQAYNDLRGAGQISNQEGQSAKAAYTRLQSQAMGSKEYKKALAEFRAEILKLTDIARVKSGLPPKFSAPEDISTAIESAKPAKRTIDMGDGFNLEVH